MEIGESGESGVSVVKHAEEDNIQEHVNAKTPHLRTVEKTVKGHSGKDDFVTRMSVQVKVC